MSIFFGKRSKNNHPSKNFYLYVYNFIKENQKLPKSKTYFKSKQALNYYVQSLKQRGLIYSSSYGVWMVRREFDYQERSKNLRGVTTPKELPKKSKYIRGHNYQWKLELPKFEHWDKIEYYLKKKQIEYYKLKNNNLKIVFNGCKFHLTTRSIILYFPTGLHFIEIKGEMCHALAKAHAYDLFKKFSKYLGVDLRVKGDYKFRMCRNHLAMINNELAKSLNNKGHKLFIKYNGRVWLITDNSFNLDELEAVDNLETRRDIDKVLTPFMNTLRVHPTILEEHDKGLAEMFEMIKKQSKLIEHLLKKSKSSIDFNSFKY